jgi:hypothetical protein
MREVDPPPGGYTWCPRSKQAKAFQPEYDQEAKCEWIDSYFFSYISAEPDTFFRIMFLNIKISDSIYLESIEIRDLLIAYAPEGIEIFTKFLDDNFSGELHSWHENQIFKDQTLSEVGHRWSKQNLIKENNAKARMKQIEYSIPFKFVDEKLR